ncbi:MAG: phasin family protein [Rhodospirillaceae bacterium]|nr:phasin family protein [Rhodospirillaceae bacterium]MBT6117007.1 phasin family protein [Rhodospirillaceae bacterium]
MAKTGTDFANFDFSKVMGDFRMPNVDFDALMAYHRKNFEAVATANKLAVEGFQKMALRQGELARAAAEKAGKDAQALFTAGTPEETVAKQAASAKEGLDTALAGYREMSGMVAETTDKTVDVVTKRMTAGMDEVKGLFGKNGATAKNGAAAK